MIRLVIKGGLNEAESELISRGIEAVDCKLAEMRGMKWGRGCVTLISVADSALDAVASWFAEQPSTPPFPAGTLLFYRHSLHG
jgi:hypothetical protein